MMLMLSLPFRGELQASHVNLNIDTACWARRVRSINPGTRAISPGEINIVYPGRKAMVKVAQPSIKPAHAVRWSLKLFPSCQSLFLISAHLENALTHFGWAHAVPFDYKQLVLIVMIKRDLTYRCPSLNPARSHLARLSADVYGGNEEASAEAISKSIMASLSPLLPRLLLPLIRLISVNFNNTQLTPERDQ